MIKKMLFSMMACLALMACKDVKETDNQVSGHHEDHLSHGLHSDDVVEVSKAAQIKELKEGGFEIFEYVDEATGDTIIMQQYFMVFLKSGPNRDQSKEEADSLQALHMGHLTRMYESGYADISGPFGDDGDLRGITIYNVPTLEMADSLARMDPAVRAGRLDIEVRPWWAGKGYPLR